MRMANFLPKAVGEDPTFPTAFDVLSMATAGAATVFPGTGCITAGGKADLILIDPSFSHLTPNWNTYSSLVYSAQVTDVRTVIINGKIIMKDWEFLTVDEAAIKREVRARAEHLVSFGQIR
ncbi:Metal-dependent hydrolase, composite domain [Moorella glycerini]|uniref:Atrazine chlorohydrolase n=1 Tax=Neomoorella stamsii TaxID=1266720 RepID=A0A9X7J5U3_9FIRM|nr:Atrazine chlorohydrolase [Moorella stamsii]CEP68287.1 Metal-dependent hydrolase, composite domain [Moorella glycerini]